MKSIKCEEDGQGISDGGNGYTFTAIQEQQIMAINGG